MIRPSEFALACSVEEIPVSGYRLSLHLLQHERRSYGFAYHIHVWLSGSTEVFRQRYINPLEDGELEAKPLYSC